MALNADRTLVKSPPELWELVDDPDLMRRWCALLIGRGEHVPVAVTLREAGERIAWRSTDEGPSVAVELSLLEKGFGTRVSITATCEGDVPGDTLESLLDELGSPQRRPFARA
ncbi:MAG: hypothetical protein ACR2OC_04350 [Solirubrobacterales bacterium]